MVAFLVFFALIHEVGPARTTVITYVNPLIAVLLGVAVLAEPFTLGIAVGMPLILVGSVLGTARSPRPAESIEDELGVGAAGAVTSPAGAARRSSDYDLAATQSRVCSTWLKVKRCTPCRPSAGSPA